ncbi:MAG: hypothetical protein SGPRY_004998, partial [Prymnesium sp.]
RNGDQSGKFHSVEVRASPAGKPISPRLMSPLVQRNHSSSGILSRARDAEGGREGGGKERTPMAPRSQSKLNAVVFSPVSAKGEAGEVALPSLSLSLLSPSHALPSPSHAPPLLCVTLFRLAVQYGEAHPGERTFRDVSAVRRSRSNSPPSL